jgi:hypothetical protein
MKQKLGDLWKRQEELKMLINAYQSELVEVESKIGNITGEKFSIYKEVYDDQNPDYIKNTEDGI